MDLFILDHETYYDQDFSLSKMSTEDYITDPRYQTMMVSIKKNHEDTIWTSGSTDHVTNWLHDQGVHKGAVVCHNHMFDGLVNAVHHDLNPPVMLCTRFMAKAVIQPYTRSVSLANCLKYINAPVRKLGYLSNMKGRRLETLSKSELRDFAQYCMVDTEGTYHLFHWLAKRIPREELEIIDMTLRMYLQPVFDADPNTFKQVLLSERSKKEKLLAALPEDIVRADLMSNPKFAQVLQRFGVDPLPTKISPTTGKVTWAFARNDPEWKELETECEGDPILAPILAARLGTKSTIAETRAERLYDIARKHGKLRIPLIYYSAHTGRYGGTEKINAQNFPRINHKLDSRVQMRYGIQAPKGFSVIAPDLSQIEARINAWLSDCNTLIQLFRDGADVYSAFASRLFAMAVTKEFPKERFIGKTCILGLGYGMGAPKLRGTLRKDNLVVPEVEAKRYVNTYRHEYPEIPALWRFCDDAIGVLVGGGKMRIGPCVASRGQIQLPNGMNLDYPNLKHIETDKYSGWSYTYAGRPRTLWGGKIVENISQSLARIKITESMRDIRKEMGCRPALQAHDELVYVVPTSEAEAAKEEMIEIMSRSPLWAPDLPLAAEGGSGPTYGDCK